MVVPYFSSVHVSNLEKSVTVTKTVIHTRYTNTSAAIFALNVGSNRSRTFNGHACISGNNGLIRNTSGGLGPSTHFQIALPTLADWR